MISSRCLARNRGIIPKLLSQHGAVLTGDAEIVDLSTAENWFLKEKLLRSWSEAGSPLALSEADLSYAEGIGGDSRTRRMLCKLVNDYFEPATVADPSHFVLAAGGSFALSALAEQILEPGDGVLVAAPYWPGLDLCFAVHNDATVIPVHIPLDEFFEVASISRYEDALQNAQEPVKAVLICNPHNPLGQCYPKATLMTILEFCRSHGLHYISNEVYALSQHQEESVHSESSGFVSVLALEPQKEFVHLIYSLSKDFGCSGMRLGALVTVNDQIRLSSALSTHSQVSSVATWIATQLVLSPENVAMVIKEGRSDLREAYRSIGEFLHERKIQFFPATCGQFVFARLLAPGKLDRASDFAQALNRNGIAISSGESYHLRDPGWFRICYAVPRHVLKEGLVRIDRCL